MSTAKKMKKTISEELAQTKGFLSGLFWGGFLGALLVFLWTTPEGRKLKAEIKEKGENFLADLPQILEELEKNDQLEEKGNTSSEVFEVNQSQNLKDPKFMEIAEPAFNRRFFKNIPKKPHF